MARGKSAFGQTSNEVLRLALICFYLFVAARPVVAERTFNNVTASEGIRPSVMDAQAAVEAAHSAMAIANARILRNRRPNRYEMLGKSAIDSVQANAPPLMTTDSGQSATSAATRRGDQQAQEYLSGGVYTVPQSLANAAIAVATSGHGTLVTGNDDYYTTIAKALRDSFRPQSNDTNLQEQKTQVSSGLLGGLIAPGSELGTIDTTKRGDPANQLDVEGGSPSWMELAFHAASPATEGTRAWRNVRDYGAAGDGKTDDTEAIRRAISYGRADEDVASGPVTVYFPPGRYVVSSTITHPSYTEIVGSPSNLPLIIAANSFVGLGLFASQPLLTKQEAWYLDSDAPQRSIRNFVFDLRPAPSHAFVTGIHWQSGQSTSIENVQFFMAENSTQVGLFIENGQGGFIGNLVFIGGRFGMLLGHQQFSSSGLYFSRCRTAIQALWDWGLGMQDIGVSDCEAGIEIVNAFTISNVASDQKNVSVARNNSISTNELTRVNNSIIRKSLGGQGDKDTWDFVDGLRSLLKRQNATMSMKLENTTDSAEGSLSFVDASFLNTKTAINATLNLGKTSLLVNNAAFSGVRTPLYNAATQVALVEGDTSLDFWSYGSVYDTSADNFGFVEGQTTKSSRRSDQLMVSPSAAKGNPVLPQRAFFHRSRPSYSSIDTRNTQVLNVLDFGAKGDGHTDDTGALNTVVDMAANLSAILCHKRKDMRQTKAARKEGLGTGACSMPD